VSDVIDLAAGLDHTCAVTRGREVYCWGLNGDGECGQPMGVTDVIAATKVF
jgi:alpha-tubulin suppressor-like RCC1 family protein